MRGFLLNYGITFPKYYKNLGLYAFRYNLTENEKIICYRVYLMLS